MKYLIFIYIIAVVAILLFILFSIFKLIIKATQGEQIFIKDEYTFKWVPKTVAIYMFGALVLSIIIFIITDSYEVTISLYIFMNVCIFVGVIRMLLIEYQAKRRGATKTKE